MRSMILATVQFWRDKKTLLPAPYQRGKRWYHDDWPGILGWIPRWVTFWPLQMGPVWLGGTDKPKWTEVARPEYPLGFHTATHRGGSTGMEMFVPHPVPSIHGRRLGWTFQGVVIGPFVIPCYFAFSLRVPDVTLRTKTKKWTFKREDYRLHVNGLCKPEPHPDTGWNFPDGSMTYILAKEPR